MLNQEQKQNSYSDYINTKNNSMYMNNNNTNMYEQKENKYEKLFNLLPNKLTQDEKKTFQSYFDTAYFAKENPVQFMYNIINKKENLMDTSETVLYGGVEYNKSAKERYNNDIVLNDEWAIPSLVFGLLGIAKVAPYLPYANDIWQGRKLLLHKPFNKMTKVDLKNYSNIGEKYYQNYLQKNPVNIKNYGEITFNKHNKGKDKTINYEQYPFLRKNIKNSKKENFSTNYKNELDRNYDYFTNKYKGDVYNYLIENIRNRGLKYKMMKNKSKGE